MPLRCRDGDREVLAFALDSDAWSDLERANRAARHLRMPCCDAPVMFRRSRLGTRYFAHIGRRDCTSAPESAEHLLAKAAIAQAILKAGWDARTECLGVAATGEHWTVDVMATRPGKWPVAFEVQWSPQTEEVTRARQSRYLSGRVRGLWLFRQPSFPSDMDVPGFQLKLCPDARSFNVCLPSPAYRARSGRSDDPGFWQQSVALETFVEGSLSGRLRFAPARSEQIDVQVLATTKHCYACGCETKIVNALQFEIGRRFPGHPDAYAQFDAFNLTPTGRDLLVRLLPPERLRNANIGQVKRRRRQGCMDSELTNGCAHCDALHGGAYDLDTIETLAPALRLTALLEPQLLDEIDDLGGVVRRWWFDDRSPN